MAIHDIFPALADAPLVLLIPNDHAERDTPWIARLERDLPNCRRLDLGMWENPHRNTWVNKINLAIHRADKPVVLVAHGLGCVALAWWAEFESPAYGDPVTAALMLSPPDVDRPGIDPRLARFSSCPRQPLPFESILVADKQSPAPARSTLCTLAQDWGSTFMEVEGVSSYCDTPSSLTSWPSVGNANLMR